MEHIIQDYGMEFEEVAVKFLGQPKTPIYFASYYSDNFQTKAILFTICVMEININKDKYSIKDLDKLKKFEKEFRSEKFEHKISMRCIEFLRNL
jgi:hypothetical protein